MKLEEVIRGLQITDRRGRFDSEVTGIAIDSRKVRPGDLFVAVRGLSRDGHNFIHDALRAGAVGVVAEEWKDDKNETRPVSGEALLPGPRGDELPARPADPVAAHDITGVMNVAQVTDAAAQAGAPVSEEKAPDHHIHPIPELVASGGEDPARAATIPPGPAPKPIVLVPSTRRSLSLLAANFYGQPSRKLLIAGITGTNGKTTVTYLLESIIKAASKSVGIIGTVECRWDNKRFELGNTTPDPVVLHQKLSEMLASGVTHVAMEVSSHALDQERVNGIHFKVAGFTNLTQDHLDYHKTLDTYFEAKARLFSQSLRKSRARGRMAVVNVDDPRGAQLLERWGGKSLSVSTDPKSTADIVALSAEYSLTGTKAVVRSSKGNLELESPLIGPHNLQNMLVAVGMALAMGFSRQRIVRGVRALERVPGRLERVPTDTGKNVYVDYAHTPDALKRLIAAMRPLCKGRIIVVFGCGGDRDKTKRGPMGRAVAEGADIAIVTNDNPRSESPEEIGKAIEAGLVEGGFSKMIGVPAAKSYRVELDRRSAIRLASDWARPEDVILIAGKGHEDYQIIGNKKHKFDDREEARRILAGMPPPPPITFDDGTSEIDVRQVLASTELSAALKPRKSTDTVNPENIVGSVDVDEPELLEVVSENDVEEIGDEAKK